MMQRGTFIAAATAFCLSLVIGTVALAVETLGPPAEFQATEVDWGHITLSWEAPSGATKDTTYDVQSQKTGAKSWDSKLGVPATRMSLRGLMPETTYRMRVRARNAQGKGAWSRKLEVTTKRKP
jgi:hypothetical protein